MNFKISNGSSQILLFEDEMGGYIQYENKPLTVSWTETDYGDDYNNHFCTLEYCKAYREKITELIQFDLNRDFTNDIKALHEELSSLFHLLENGEYELSISNDTQTIKFPENPHYPLRNQERGKWSILVTDPPVKPDNEPLTCYDNADLEISDTFDSCYLFDSSDLSFLATIPETAIDEDRIQYFESQLQKGKRPLAIILHYFDRSDEHFFYILDGHCKLMAYGRQQIAPYIVFITQHKKQDFQQEYFDIEQFIDLLHPRQIRFILRWRLYRGSFIHELAKKPGSKLHRFIKNGNHEMYHPNGQLKSSAFYIDDIPEGIFKQWYDNGQLERTYSYEYGKPHGICSLFYESGARRYETHYEHGNTKITKGWYEHGELSSDSIYDENGRRVEEREWHENGKLKYQLTYKNGSPVEKKRWNIQGKIIEHKIFNKTSDKQQDTSSVSLLWYVLSLPFLFLIAFFLAYLTKSTIFLAIFFVAYAIFVIWLYFDSR